jgi:hypothetical protein
MDRGWLACNINTLRVGWATHGRLVDKIKYDSWFLGLCHWFLELCRRKRDRLIGTALRGTLVGSTP